MQSPFDPSLARRCWLKSIAGVTVAAFVGDLAGDRLMADASDGVLLAADPTRVLHRVRMELDIQGNVHLPSNPLVSQRKKSQLPIESQTVLDWEERLLAEGDDGCGHLAERYYHQAASSSRAGKQARRVELRPHCRQVRIHRDTDRWVIYSLDSFLDRHEVELLSEPACSLAVDAMLPGRTIGLQQSYRPEDAVLAKLLGLAAVQESSVEAELVALDDELAKIHFQGKIEGSVAGVASSIELAGKLNFDRQARTCTWLALSLRERRQPGKLEPGFDIAATVRMARKPLDAPQQLADQPPEDFDGDIPGDRLLTELSSEPVGYAVMMDRRWKMMNDAAGQSMMRMIDNDVAIAQVNLQPLGKMAAGKQLTLEAFVAESKKSLGKRLVEVLQASEAVNDSGLRVLRVATQGVAQELPIQWHFIQFSDDTGRRLSATVTVANDHLDVFAGADEQLTESLRFLPLDDDTLEVSAQRSDKAARR